MISTRSKLRLLDIAAEQYGEHTNDSIEVGAVESLGSKVFKNGVWSFGGFEVGKGFGGPGRHGFR